MDGDGSAAVGRRHRCPCDGRCLRPSKCHHSPSRYVPCNPSYRAPMSPKSASTGPEKPFWKPASAGSACRFPSRTFTWCYRLAKLIANATRQRITEESPILSASLPTGERVQLVLPPATSAGCVAITIRRPSGVVWSLSELADMGVFAKARRATESLDEVEQQLLALAHSGQYEVFMRLAVHARKNIVVSGRHGIRQNHVHSCPDSGDSSRGAARHHRGCTRTRVE